MDASQDASARSRSKRPCPIDHLSPVAQPAVLKKTLEQLVDLASLEDDIEIQENVDPRSLCPWCDETLPAKPSKTLLRMIGETKKLSYAAPRSTNSLGLKAPFSQYLHVCERHTFERDELSKAKANKWPQRINFRRLGARVEDMYDDLQLFILDKSESVFWTQLEEKISKRGTLATLSLANQYMNVEEEVLAG